MAQVLSTLGMVLSTLGILLQARLDLGICALQESDCWALLSDSPQAALGLACLLFPRVPAAKCGLCAGLQSDRGHWAALWADYRLFVGASGLDAGPRGRYVHVAQAPVVDLPRHPQKLAPQP